jgi:F0F1-type ATP synthase membrane subunit a
MRNNDSETEYPDSNEPIGLGMRFVLIFTVVSNIGITMICWGWWLKTPSDRWLAPFTLMICHWVGCYAIGYKKFFLAGFRKYFYLTWFSMAILSTTGVLLRLALGYR